MNKSNKNNGFKTPENYFEGLTDRLLDKLSEENSVLPKDDGFVVPDGYFDSLNEKITNGLSGEETKVIPLKSYRNYYYAAASIAAVALVIFGLQWNTSETLTFESLAATDIENYFENNDYDLSAYEIAEVIPIAELEINDILTNRFEEDNIVDYLDDHIEDFEELNLEEHE